MSYQDNFKEATRSSAFSLSFGIREVRLLATNLDAFRSRFTDGGILSARPQPTELAALQRLIGKGLVEEQVSAAGHKTYHVTPIGSIVRHLMVMSDHIRVDEPKEPVSNADVVEIVNHALQWYRDGNSWLYGSRIQKVDGEQSVIVTTRRNQNTDPSKPTQAQQQTEWKISPKEIVKVF